MRRPATEIALNGDERRQLTSMLHRTKVQARSVERTRIVLSAGG